MNEMAKHTVGKRPPYRARERPGAMPQAARDERPDTPPPKARPAVPSLGKDILYLLIKIAAILLAFVLLFTFMYGLYRAENESMAPAIRDGDLVVYFRLDTVYAAGDTLLLEFEGQRQIRRVIATAGDVVDITEDGLLINGALQQEPAIYQRTERYEDGVEFPLTVGEGEVFVLADARENGTDSRVYGAVAVKDTLGKVMTVLRRRNI